RARRREPLASFLQLRAEHAQLARAHIELAGSLAQPLRLGSGSLDLRLPVAELLLRERDAPLARAALFLRLPHQAAPPVPVGAARRGRRRSPRSGARERRSRQIAARASRSAVARGRRAPPRPARARSAPRTPPRIMTSGAAEAAPLVPLARDGLLRRLLGGL